MPQKSFRGISGILAIEQRLINPQSVRATNIKKGYEVEVDVPSSACLSPRRWILLTCNQDCSFFGGTLAQTT